MSRNFKNIIKKEERSHGLTRRENLAKELFRDSTPLPNPVEHKDIDEEFKRWVEEDLRISYEGTELPTMVLFSNQRFSEFMQSWDNVDDRKNLILNFKTITRENNPKYGTINGQSHNIPGERTYLMKRVESVDDAGRTYYTDYRVKQPISVDFIYTLTIVASKYELLNEFNLLINDKFKSIDCYIRPKGHFMPMKLTEISDESEYSIDNRQYYSQSYNIILMGYIMPQDSFIVEERAKMKFIGFEGDKRKKSYAEIEELPCWEEKEEPKYDNIPVRILIHFAPCESSYKFNIDCNFKATEVDITQNVRSFKLYVNDQEKELTNDIEFKMYDEIKFKGLTRYRMIDVSEIKIYGFDPSSSYNKEEGEKIINITN